MLAYVRCKLTAKPVFIVHQLRSAQVHLNSISAMEAYKGKSPEELRWEDYQAGVKGGTGQPQQAAGGFGQPSTGFGAPASPFGAASSSAFGTSTFGASQSAFGVRGPTCPSSRNRTYSHDNIIPFEQHPVASSTHHSLADLLLLHEGLINPSIQRRLWVVSPCIWVITASIWVHAHQRRSFWRQRQHLPFWQHLNYPRCTRGHSCCVVVKHRHHVIPAYLLASGKQSIAPPWACSCAAFGGGFVAQSTPAFGQSSTPAFGAQSAATPAFGSTGAFGGFAASSAAASFGFSSSAFGASSAAAGASLFGGATPASPFGGGEYQHVRSVVLTQVAACL